MFILRKLKQCLFTRKICVLHVILFACLMSLVIHGWQLFGCPGLREYYLCQPFSPEAFCNASSVDTSSNDFSRLMNLENFTFIMNNFVCNTSDLMLLVLIHSHPDHFKKRNTIRTTWGKVFNDEFRLLFLFGLPTNIKTQNKLIKENDVYKDLIQGNFVDAYRNLTYKHVMAFKWTKYFCSNAKYILKTDDDVFVNTPRFLQYLKNTSDPVPETRVMRCEPIYMGVAWRTFRSKWRVTWSEFKFRYYPTFCQGLVILYSPDVVFTLYSLAQTANFFWIDDVFVTGILGFCAGYEPSTFGNLILSHENFDKVINKNSNELNYLIGPMNMDGTDIKKLWKKVYKTDYDRMIGN